MVYLRLLPLKLTIRQSIQIADHPAECPNTSHLKQNRKQNVWSVINLRKAIEDSGLSQEGYLRQLIDGYIPRPNPGPDYHAMVQTLYKIVNQMDRIAQCAICQKVFDPAKYREIVNILLQKILEIEKQTLLPMKMK